MRGIPPPALSRPAAPGVLRLHETAQPEMTSLLRVAECFCRGGCAYPALRNPPPGAAFRHSSAGEILGFLGHSAAWAHISERTALWGVPRLGIGMLRIARYSGEGTIREVVARASWGEAREHLVDARPG